MPSKVPPKTPTSKAISKRGDLFHDSRPLNLVLMTNDPCITQAVDELYEELEFKGQAKLIKNCLRVLLANLARVQNFSPSTWLRLPASSNVWTDLAVVPELNPLGISYKIIEVVRVLRKAGCLEYHKGYNARTKKEKRYSVVSRLRSTQHMKDFIQHHLLASLLYTPTKKTPLIRMKGKKAEPLKLNPKRIPKAVKQSEKFLERYNAFISLQSLGFAKGKRAAGLFLDEMFVYRVFNRGSYTSLGRLYGGWWMLCSKELRPFITINGQATCELDYRALHPHLLYAQAGIPAPTGDMYSIKGLDRGLVKLAMLTMLNAKDLTDAYKGLLSRLKKEAKAIQAISGYDDEEITELLEPWKYKQEHLSTMVDFDAHLVQPILAKHKAIEGNFIKDQGTYLQYLDSCICLKVLEEMTNQGIPCISIHDSFVIPATHEQSLRLAMEKAYIDILNNNNINGECPPIHLR